ncbi:MAG: 4Fe-4S binding protein [Cyanobacteria bacterium J06581_3]
MAEANLSADNTRDHSSQPLTGQIEAVSAQLAYEKERQQALRPYLVTRVKRGVVGSSRYASRLRQDIREVTRNEPDSEWDNGSEQIRHQPVLIFGEPGLNKDNLAALIHFGSSNKANPIIQVNCEKLRSQDLFGRSADHPGLLEWLGAGTLVLNNIQDLGSELKPTVLELIKTGTYQTGHQNSENPQTKHSPAWILMISEKVWPEVSNCPIKKIKVPPLRVRKADIEAQVNYFSQLFCRARGLCKRRLEPAALRRLQSYDFPGNLTELETMVKRAVLQSMANEEETAKQSTTMLTEEVFWATESPQRRFRFNLLKGYPQLRQFLLSPWWPTRINYGFTLWFYPIVVAVLFWGPQTRDGNFALNFFWAWWWPLVLIGFPFVGRLWCAVCPFMIYGEVAQKLSLIVWPRKLQGWPRAWAERWGGWILYGGFVLILLWEELWNLENTAYLSGWLLLIITAGAVVCSVLFERRFWCRYLCPIGGMNGLFAKLSMVELRAQQGICSAACNTYHCYKGGPAEGEGQKTAGCPVYSHPAQLSDNRNCVLCMTCLKACPHQSVALNLRPPGVALWTSHTTSGYEVALLLLLLGAVLLHRLPQLTTLLFGDAAMLSSFGGHVIAATVTLLLPSVLVWGCDRLRTSLSQLFSKFSAQQVHRTGPNRGFLELAYGYLPLLLLASLAHYLLMGLSEAGQILPVFKATLSAIPGISDNTHALAILGNLADFSFQAHPAVIAFLQGVALLLGALLSLMLTQKIGRQPWSRLLPQHGMVLGLTLLFWQLIV